MSKLSLLDKFRVYRKNKNWLTAGRRIEELRNIGIDVYLDQYEAVWIAEETPKGKNVKEISKNENKMFHFNTSIHKNGGIYFLGTEGLFFKENKTEEIQMVYKVKTITGAKVLVSKGIIILYQEENDVILQFDQDNLGKIEKVINCKIVFINKAVNELQRKIFDVSDEHIMKLLIIVKENNYYYTYSAGGSSIELCRSELRFNSFEVKKLLDREPAIASTEEYAKQLVYLKGKHIDFECEIETIFKEILECKKIKDYYFITTTNGLHIIQKETDGFTQIGGVIEKWEYQYLVQHYDITLFKAKTEEGIIVLAIRQNDVAQKKYKGAKDIIVPESIKLLDEENFFSIKPEIIY